MFTELPLSINADTFKESKPQFYRVEKQSFWGKLPSNILFGKQGTCTSSKYILARELLVSKSVVMVSRNRLVPIKLLNPTKDKIELYKGKTLATFSEITSEHLLIPFNENSKHSVHYFVLYQICKSQIRTLFGYKYICIVIQKISQSSNLRIVHIRMIKAKIATKFFNVSFRLYLVPN
jgi:hypothetical protein